MAKLGYLTERVKMKHLINRTLLRADLHEIQSGQNQALLKLSAIVDLIRSNGLITTSNGTMTLHWESVLRAERVWEYGSLLEIAELEDRSLRILDCGRGVDTACFLSWSTGLGGPDGPPQWQPRRKY